MAGARLGAIWVAAAAVGVGSVLAGFRLEFAGDLELLLRANGARVLLALGAGAALALSGSIRLAAGRARPLGELELLAVSAGAASGGFLAVDRLANLPDWPAFAVGATFGAVIFVGGVRLLDRPRRWTNAGVAAALGVFIAAAALAGTFARAREDSIAAAVAWLLGDVSSASLTGAAPVLAVAIALAALASQAISHGESGSRRLDTLGWLALGLGVGAAGPIAFVGTFAPRAVRALAPRSSPRARMAASVAAGAAGVAAISAVSHLLVGGYAFPLNVGAGILAVPAFLGWNRRRLRVEAGSTRRAWEVGEVILILVATGIATALVVILSAVVGFAT